MIRLSDQPASIEFGHFSILPHRRQLLTEGRPVRLGGRAFDLLLALIETPGAVVGKDELLSRIWPGRIVEETGWRARFRRYAGPSVRIAI
jgi:DNA-binding winged helix-turn-helix (wHTH) protein